MHVKISLNLIKHRAPGHLRTPLGVPSLEYHLRIRWNYTDDDEAPSWVSQLPADYIVTKSWAELEELYHDVAQDCRKNGFHPALKFPYPQDDVNVWRYMIAAAGDVGYLQRRSSKQKYVPNSEAVSGRWALQSLFAGRQSQFNKFFTDMVQVVETTRCGKKSMRRLLTRSNNMLLPTRPQTAPTECVGTHLGVSMVPPSPPGSAKPRPRTTSRSATPGRKNRPQRSATPDARLPSVDRPKSPDAEAPIPNEVSPSNGATQTATFLQNEGFRDHLGYFSHKFKEQFPENWQKALHYKYQKSCGAWMQRPFRLKPSESDERLGVVEKCGSTCQLKIAAAARMVVRPPSAIRQSVAPVNTNVPRGTLLLKKMMGAKYLNTQIDSALAAPMEAHSQASQMRLTRKCARLLVKREDLRDLTCLMRRVVLGIEPPYAPGENKLFRLDVCRAHVNTISNWYFESFLAKSIERAGQTLRERGRENLEEVVMPALSDSDPLPVMWHELIRNMSKVPIRTPNKNAEKQYKSGWEILASKRKTDFLKNIFHVSLGSILGWIYPGIATELMAQIFKWIAANELEKVRRPMPPTLPSEEYEGLLDLFKCLDVDRTGMILTDRLAWSGIQKSIVDVETVRAVCGATHLALQPFLVLMCEDGYRVNDEIQICYVNGIEFIEWHNPLIEWRGWVMSDPTFLDKLQYYIVAQLEAAIRMLES